jgi:hypothetical protein
MTRLIGRSLVCIGLLLVCVSAASVPVARPAFGMNYWVTDCLTGFCQGDPPCDFETTNCTSRICLTTPAEQCGDCTGCYRAGLYCYCLEKDPIGP